MKHNRVGLGTYPFANVYSPLSKKGAKNVVRLFIDKGGYYIDTAPVYGFGEVETLLGEVLRDFPREKYYISTKCGYVDVEGKTFQTVQKSGKYEDVIDECEKSLKRLRTDYIDLYFVHWPDPNTPFDETMSALSKLQEDGKIKEIGVSNITLEELQEYNKRGGVKYIQNRFSLINRSISRELEEYMMDNSIKLVPYQIIDRGLLTEKVQEKSTIIGDWVRTSLSPIAKRAGITLSQLSIAWALHQKFVGFVLVGVTNPQNVEINLHADSILLSDETMRQIDDAIAILSK